MQHSRLHDFSVTVVVLLDFLSLQEILQLVPASHQNPSCDGCSVWEETQHGIGQLHLSPNMQQLRSPHTRLYDITRICCETDAASMDMHQKNDDKQKYSLTLTCTTRSLTIESIAKIEPQMRCSSQERPLDDSSMPTISTWTPAG